MSLSPPRSVRLQARRRRRRRRRKPRGGVSVGDSGVGGVGGVGVGVGRVGGGGVRAVGVLPCRRGAPAAAIAAAGGEGEREGLGAAEQGGAMQVPA